MIGFERDRLGPIGLAVFLFSPVFSSRHRVKQPLISKAKTSLTRRRNERDAEIKKLERLSDFFAILREAEGVRLSCGNKSVTVLFAGGGLNEGTGVSDRGWG